MRKPFLLIAAASLAILTACSSTPTATTTANKEPEKLVSVYGQSALYRMYQMARAWSPDAQVLKLASLHLTEAPDGPPGAAPAWQATFTSASKGRARSYTFSIVESEGNLHKGPFAGPEQNWSGPSGVTTPFPILAVKVETDAAYKSAMTTPQSKAADYDKKNPGKPITILLEKNNKFPDPAWRIIWGESIGTSNFSVFVDASTGTYLETMR